VDWRKMGAERIWMGFVALDGVSVQEFFGLDPS
jgi:hypothetical protein